MQEISQANRARRQTHSSQSHPRRKSSTYLLSGILRCARCNGMMNGLSSPTSTDEDYRRYICSTSKIKKTCAAKPIP
ncbi:zinc ribbon domain-containing protein, partial [Listeria monocytogenes]|uniref:zinc ribbon domain-containing protein n=1 Tax=Listeria monocytogenes TaxID=1639 RepID=UPI003C6DB1F7